jgi:LuxR family maltose regulon positive regulatory protein
MLAPSYKVESFHLIQTKLHRPQVNVALLERPHLLTRLDDGLNHKLILVSAPPGFGKTTLVSQWLAGCDRPFIWLSLDEGDNQLPQFLRYLCAAVRQAIPEACTTLQALLNTATLPSLDYLADLLVEELNALPTELILVLDDYHHIRASDVHHLLRQLLRYHPPRLHLVILTRSDPPLYLGRLRLGQHITEIRAADLRFAVAETRRFLQYRTGRLLDEEEIQDLQGRTEGWVIGLQLASLSLRSQSPAQFLARFGGNHRLLVGYLVEEVMAGLPADVAEFLTRTALVDRFCAPLGDALLADSLWPDTSQTTIAHLEAQNLFIVPLDDQGTWFRYHDLFRDFLLHQLKQEQDQAGLAGLHRHAGA